MTRSPAGGPNAQRQVLVALRWREGQPDLPAVAQRLNTRIGALDEAFSVVLLDPERSLWAVRARYDELPAQLGDDAWIAEDPPINVG